MKEDLLLAAKGRQARLCVWPFSLALQTLSLQDLHRGLRLSLSSREGKKEKKGGHGGIGRNIGNLSTLFYCSAECSMKEEEEKRGPFPFTALNQLWKTTNKKDKSDKTGKQSHSLSLQEIRLGPLSVPGRRQTLIEFTVAASQKTHYSWV